MSNTKWVKFKKQGMPYGFAYFAGAVVEIPADRYKPLLEDGVVIPAEPNEVEAAKKALESVQVSETVAPRSVNAGLVEEVADLKETVASLQAVIAQLVAQNGPASVPASTPADPAAPSEPKPKK